MAGEPCGELVFRHVIRMRVDIGAWGTCSWMNSSRDAAELMLFLHPICPLIGLLRRGEVSHVRSGPGSGAVSGHARTGGGSHSKLVCTKSDSIKVTLVNDVQGDSTETASVS